MMRRWGGRRRGRRRGEERYGEGGVWSGKNVTAIREEGGWREATPPKLLFMGGGTAARRSSMLKGEGLNPFRG